MFSFYHKRKFLNLRLKKLIIIILTIMLKYARFLNRHSITDTQLCTLKILKNEKKCVFDCDLRLIYSFFEHLCSE